MGKYIHRKTARKCPVHKMVLDVAKSRIEIDGWFSKELILDRKNITGMQDSIRWDYIADFINEDLNIELIPVVSQFKKAIKGDYEKIIKFPERFIASGHGKRTWGYANADQVEGMLAIRSLAQKQVRAIGTVKSAVKKRDSLIEAGVIEDKNDPRLKKQLNKMPSRVGKLPKKLKG